MDFISWVWRKSGAKLTKNQSPSLIFFSFCRQFSLFPLSPSWSLATNNLTTSLSTTSSTTSHQRATLTSRITSINFISPTQISLPSCFCTATPYTNIASSLASMFQHDQPSPLHKIAYSTSSSSSSSSLIRLITTCNFAYSKNS